jgi:hypothetical protein
MEGHLLLGILMPIKVQSDAQTQSPETNNLESPGVKRCSILRIERQLVSVSRTTSLISQQDGQSARAAINGQ